MANKEEHPYVKSTPEADKKNLDDAINGAKTSGVAAGLSHHLSTIFNDNQEYFRPYRLVMVKLLRRCKGEYESEKLRDIKAFSGTEANLRSGETKARAAESWIKDIYRDKSKLFNIYPTAVPEIPDEDLEQIVQEVKAQGMAYEAQIEMAGGVVDESELFELIDTWHNQRMDEERKRIKREAQKRCDRASLLIKDEAQEGNLEDAFNKFLWYFTRLNFGLLKGPVLTYKPKHKWIRDAQGVLQFATVNELVTDTYAVNPFNFFPSRDMSDINNGATVELHQLSEQAISSLREVPGYSKEEIEKVLVAYKGGSLKPKWFTLDDESEVKNAQKELREEKRAQYDAKQLIWAQEFYGPVSGKMLLDWGIENDLEKGAASEIDPYKIYQANCWKIGPYVIKAVVNPDDLGRKPYHISSWSKHPDNLIGEGLVEFGSVVEDAMNASFRALINNVAIASGPMAEVDTDRVDLDTPMYPWRTIKSSSRRMLKSGPAVHYYQPEMRVQEITVAFKFFSVLLDEMTVPAYAQGAAQSGVTAGTATVFTELLAAASRSIKAVIANIDNDVIKPWVQMSYDRHMSTTTDDSLKADANIVAGGVASLQIKEQQAQRKVEFLQITANPVVQQILGQENIGSIISQVAESNDIELPDKDRLDGTVDLQAVIDKLLTPNVGGDGQQALGQMGNGGGAPTKPQVLQPNGAAAGTVMT
jgi:hypothetical protein